MRYMFEGGFVMWPILLLAIVTAILILANAVRLFGQGRASARTQSSVNAILFWATGRLNGEDGWRVMVWATDTGEPGSGPNAGGDSDSWLVWLIRPSGGVAYSSLLDFPPEQSLRHNLDHGNLQLHVAGN